MFFDDGTYRVSRCRSDGTLQVSQLVGEIPVPDNAVARVPLDQYDGLGGLKINGYIPEYGSPDDPRWAAKWRALGAQATAAVIPPTTLP